MQGWAYGCVAIGALALVAATASASRATPIQIDFEGVVVSGELRELAPSFRLRVAPGDRVRGSMVYDLTGIADDIAAPERAAYRLPSAPPVLSFDLRLGMGPSRVDLAQGSPTPQNQIVVWNDFQDRDAFFARSDLAFDSALDLPTALYAQFALISDDLALLASDGPPTAAELEGFAPNFEPSDVNFLIFDDPLFAGRIDWDVQSFGVRVVPEPGSGALLLVGLACLPRRRARRCARGSVQPPCLAQPPCLGAPNP